jgi:competence protein ComEC
LIDHNRQPMTFWREHPALFYALALLIGTSAPLFFGHYFWVALFLFYLLLHRAFPQIVVLFGAVFYGIHSEIPKDFETKNTQGIFSPSSIAIHQSPFTQQVRYQGTYIFDGKKLPCSIFFPKHKKRLKGNKSYQIEGILSKRGQEFIIKPKKWEKIPYSWSLAELRFKTKTGVKKYLSKKLESGPLSFLNAIATGTSPDRLLRYEFGRVGLQHILAISGFHFGILIAFFSYAFGYFLHSNWKIGALFLISTAYFIFIGSSPSVERSYITALFYLISKWISRPTTGLNLLGVAAAVELLFNPYIGGNIGFHLSFLSCLGILMFFPIIDQLAQKIIPKRTFEELSQFSLFDQHGYLLASFFRKVISLNLAISGVLIPLLLYHFHQFPLLSLVYNLFAPTLVGVIVILFLLALIFDFLFTPLSSCFFWITNALTKELLELIENPPLAMDISLYATNIPAWGVIFYLIMLGLLGIHWKNKEANSLRIREI